MTNYADHRLRQVNDRDVAVDGRYVLYWMQAYRRLDHNHALDHALAWAIKIQKPLVVYEGLKLGYPWASARLHRFILEGMEANTARAAELGVNYWPFVETPEQPGVGLLRELSEAACLIVTDDFPSFIHPRQTAALAMRSSVRVVAVDGNSVVPLSLLGQAVSAAAHLRTRIHKAFAGAWPHRAVAEPKFPASVRAVVDPPFAIWKSDDLNTFIAGLPIDQAVAPVEGITGGTPFARKRLRDFVKRRLEGYAEHRSKPAPPEEGHASGLSAHLHFGHISIEEVVGQALGQWNVTDLNPDCQGKREGFFSDDADINSFVDEAMTWRDVGYHWHRHRTADAKSLDTALPPWALTTLRKHGADRREHLYTPEEFEKADTHDPLWNAAQTELKATGFIHNYLRMLWGKKVLEWSETPEEAYRTLVHLNNKYALDGRDPNSYTGILWCFGLFDRPWAPERPVYGVIRYMSSANTARKFKVKPYLEYASGLGESHGQKSLF